MNILRKNMCLNPLKRVNSILTAVAEEGVIEEYLMSQSPQTGQFNSYFTMMLLATFAILVSQSPQTGQFNSYMLIRFLLFSQASKVSIPSNGSIQFLQHLQF